MKTNDALRTWQIWVGFIAGVVVTSFLLSLGGCSVAPLQASRTEATLELEDGRVFRYFSNKEQSGVDVRIRVIDPKTKKVLKEYRLQVEKTGTPEAAYAAMIQQQAAMTEQHRAVTDLIRSFLAAAAGSAAPGP